VVADGVDQSAEAVRLSQGSFGADKGHDTDEGFLTDVFDGFFWIQSRAQLKPDEFAEVGYEMLFGSRISAPEFFQVQRVERNELQSVFLPSG
jgi:hypothetical protein